MLIPDGDVTIHSYMQYTCMQATRPLLSISKQLRATEYGKRADDTEYSSNSIIMHLINSIIYIAFRHICHLSRVLNLYFQRAPLTSRPHATPILQRVNPPIPVRAHSPRTRFPLSQDLHLVGKHELIRISLTYTPFCCLGPFAFETFLSTLVDLWGGFAFLGSLSNLCPFLSLL